MTNQLVNAKLAFVNALRARNIFSIKCFDAYEEDNCLEVKFTDKEGEWVLTNPITSEEAKELMSNLPKARRRMMVRAYGI